MRAIQLIEKPSLPSPALIAWVKTWVESSFKIKDQIASFAPLMAESERFLNVSYPALYRGMSISEEQAETLRSGETISVPVHELQSWTKSRSIASDYALPGYGGDVGILIRMTGKQVTPVVDIENIIRTIGARNLGNIFQSRDIVTDISREREVVVQTSNPLALTRKNVLLIN